MPSFASVDTAHAAAGGVFPDGSGPPEAQPPEYYYPILYPPEVDRTVKMTLRFPFDAPGSQILSNPSPNPTTPTDPSRLVGLRWNIYGVATEACAVNSLSIDDVMFYKDPPDGGQDAPPDTSSGD